MKITIKEVAKMSGVSVATVSRVMSNSDKISIDTKNRVNKVIKELGYTPNSTAQNLTKQNTKIIGVILQAKDTKLLQNSFFTKIITKLSNLAIQEGYYILYIHCNSSIDETDKVNQLIKSKRVDGLIFLTLKNSDKLLKHLTDIDFPYVVIGRPTDEKNTLWVDNNNIESTENITAKFLKKGYNNIIFLGGSKKLTVTKDRLQGYLNAHLKNGVKVDKRYILESDFDDIKAYKIIQKFNKNNQIDAIITTDDILAIGAIKALKHQEIPIIGFNDTLIRKYITKKFATFNIGVDKLALSAYTLLMKKINNEMIDKNFEIISTKFIDKNK